MRFTFSYTGIRVRDFERSLRFYRDLLGMKVLRRSKDADTRGEWAILESEAGGQTLEINWYEEGSPFGGPYGVGEAVDHLAFRVDEFDAAVAYLSAAGHPTVLGPTDDGRYRVAYVEDPDGITVEIFHVRDRP